MDSIIFQGYMVLGVVFLSLTNLAHVTFNLFDFLKYIWQKEKAIQSLRAENVLSGYKQAAPIVFAVTSTSSAKKRLSSPFRTTRIQCVGVACCVHENDLRGATGTPPFSRCSRCTLLQQVLLVAHSASTTRAHQLRSTKGPVHRLLSPQTLERTTIHIIRFPI